MILDQWNQDAFQCYAKPLEKLEKNFNKAGHPVSFYAFVDSFGNKMVTISHNKAQRKTVCIEWESPAMAARDVAAGVSV